MNRAAPNGSAGRVLIVEDDEGIRDMLKYNLSTAGFLVHEASDGASGLRTARTAKSEEGLHGEHAEEPQKTRRRAGLNKRTA